MHMQWAPDPSPRVRGAAYLNVDEREGNELHSSHVQVQRDIVWRKVGLYCLERMPVNMIVMCV
jgi:hypothetical protein